MDHSTMALALAVLGFGVGLTFRLKVLLLTLLLLLLASIVFSLGRGFSFLDTALTIMAAQTVVQGSFFAGMVARTMLTNSRRVL